MTTLTVVKDKGNIIGFDAISRDITEMKICENQIRALHLHATSLAKAVSIREIAEISSNILKVLGFKNGSLGIVEEDQLIHQHFLVESNGTPIVMPLDGPGITVRAINVGETLNIGNVCKCPHFVKDTDTHSEPIISELAIPIKINNKPMAVLNVVSSELDAFKNTDVQRLETLVEHIESAVERILTMRSHLKQIEEIETEKTSELLKGADRISSMVRHDLRGPLSTIKKAAHLMESSPETTDEMISTIFNSVDYAMSILEDLKQLTKPRQLNKTFTDPRKLITSILDTTLIPDDIKVISEYDNIQPFLMDEIKLRRAIDNLIRNAVEAMPDGGKLKLRLLRDGDNTKFEVSDTGYGMSEEVKNNLFTPFFTTKTTGTGLGLASCKQSIEAHGGTIEYESSPGCGTKFTVSLPIALNAEIDTVDTETQIPYMEK
ncbi:MAG: GAF domain-containing sensor histidine kinase [Candidatus Bathyarchaeota archaeon]|nr:GAF domain-containing sensor histidine kinase [Candidatus Bathyarchaeota archaeon]